MKAIDIIFMIEAATFPGLLFTGDADKDKRNFRKWSALIHPDHIRDAAIKPRAEKAFAKMSGWYSGIGKAKPEVHKVGRWIIDRPLERGDIANLYVGKDGATEAIIKVVRSEDDNDLMERESGALKDLSEWSEYFPAITVAISLGDRKANILEPPNGSLPLSYLKSLNLDFRHIVWMGNRLWSALTVAHVNGIVHGAVLPQHLLYHPLNHSLRLIDWTCSVRGGSGQSIPYMVKGQENFYPPEVLRRQVSEATDIYMAAKCLREAAANIPATFMPLFDWCMASSPNARPKDVSDVHDLWKSTSHELYGPRKYLKLEVPMQ